MLKHVQYGRVAPVDEGFVGREASLNLVDMSGPREPEIAMTRTGAKVV